MRPSRKALAAAIIFYSLGLIISISHVIWFYTPGFNGVNLLVLLSSFTGLFFWFRFLRLARQEEQEAREARDAAHFDAHMAEFKRQYGLEFFDQNDEEK